MITIQMPSISKNTWKLYLKNSKDMIAVFYENEKPEDDVDFLGITEYYTLSLYINKEMNKHLVMKVLRHELMHIYLWENNLNGENYSAELVCKTLGKIAPLICEEANRIALKLDISKTVKMGK